MKFSMTGQKSVTFNYRWLHGQAWLYIIPYVAVWNIQYGRQSQ